jgi:hypothetical protein
MLTPIVTKEDILQTLEELPAESLAEVWQFLSYLKFKMATKLPEGIASLGGLLQGYCFSEKDIAEARREMWGNL